MYFQFVKNLLMGHLKIALVFAIFTIPRLISESLLGKTPITMSILKECLGTFSPYNSAMSLTLIFEEFIFNFDLRCASRNLLHINVSTYPNNDYRCSLYNQ